MFLDDEEGVSICAVAAGVWIVRAAAAMITARKITKNPRVIYRMLSKQGNRLKTGW